MRTQDEGEEEAKVEKSFAHNFNPSAGAIAKKSSPLLPLGY
jgi:hypothetical protein